MKAWMCPACHVKLLSRFCLRPRESAGQGRWLVTTTCPRCGASIIITKAGILAKRGKGAKEG